MDPSDLPDETLFEGALNCRTPEERAAYLDRVCANNPKLRQQLEALLSSHEQSGHFLETPPTDRPTIRLELPATEEVTGTTIGRYKLLQKIGEGGMGDVYMAEQTEPVVRKVAFKIIKLGMDTKQVVARFEAERQALALMDHPNIAKVLDAGATDTGRPFFVMELVHGVPITEYCDKNRLTTEPRLKLFIAVCQAIQHAHQKGIIHRDIKPSNVMVTLHDGVPVPKVIDFGVAKATNQRLTEKTLFTNYAQMIGTPAYMSPEQAEMSGLDIDTRTDVYALGVLLYELLTGTTPFDAKELLRKGYAEMQRIIAQEEPLKPSTKMSTLQEEQRTVVAGNRGVAGATLSRTLRGDLDWIVMKCLEKDRTRRYETANGLAMDLHRHLHSEAITARPPSSAYLVQKLIKRNKLVFACGIAVGLAMLVTLVVLIFTTIRVTRERNQKTSALQAESAAKEEATQRTFEAREQLFIALTNQARAFRTSGRLGQRVKSLAALSAAAQIHQDANLRDEAIAALARPDLQPGQSPIPWEPGNYLYPLAFDALYQRYARIEPNGEIFVCSSEDGRVIQQISSQPIKEYRFLGLSPDGECVAKLEADGRLRIWRVADGGPAWAQQTTNCSAVAFSQDSRWLVTGEGNSIIRIDLQSGREINRWATAGPVSQLAIDSTDQKLAVAYFRGEEISIHQVLDGKTIAALVVGPTSPQALAWHHSGDYLAVGGVDSRIQVWNIQSRECLATLQGHAQRVTALGFHPLSDLLASYGWDGVLRLWEPWSGRQLLETPSQTVIQFSSDGRWLGSGWEGREQYQMLQISYSSVYASLPYPMTPRDFTIFDGDLSSDGRWFVCGTDQGVQLRSLPDGQIAALLPIGASWSPLFTPDGKSILVASVAGVSRWPFQQLGPDHFQIGPPTTIPLPFPRPMRASISSDGRTLAVVSERSGKAVVVDPASDQPPRMTVDHQAAGCVELSKDARVFATSGWHSRVVRLFETQSGQLLGEWPVPPYSRAFLSPDNRTLVISQGYEYSFWNVATTNLMRRLPRQGSGFGGIVAFSADGQLIALPISPGIVEIQLTESGQTVARLEDPFGDRSGWMAFTADNHDLIVCAPYAPAIHVWHLDELRRQLSEFSGDWPGFPPLPDQKNTERTVKRPVPTVEVVGLVLLENN